LKIGETPGNSSNRVDVRGKEPKRTSGGSEACFQSRLNQVECRNYEDKLNELISKIMAQGQRLGEKIDIRELKIYKKLIAEFLRETIENTTKFSKQSFLDRRGRHRVYALVRKINNELELLTRDILNDEKDKIRILQRLDDIRGLVLDIVM
jgi:uncharacterized protein YaaR (DUF327 family)